MFLNLTFKIQCVTRQPTTTSSTSPSYTLYLLLRYILYIHYERIYHNPKRNTLTQRQQQQQPNIKLSPSPLPLSQLSRLNVWLIFVLFLNCFYGLCTAFGIFFINCVRIFNSYLICQQNSQIRVLCTITEWPEVVNVFFHFL